MVEPWTHRVAVLFSGGGSPGMNALLGNLVRLGSNRHGGRVVGVKDGFNGLVRTAARVYSGQGASGEIQKEIMAYPGLVGMQRATQDLVLMDQARRAVCWTLVGSFLVRRDVPSFILRAFGAGCSNCWQAWVWGPSSFAAGKARLRARRAWQAKVTCE